MNHTYVYVAGPVTEFVYCDNIAAELSDLDHIHVTSSWHGLPKEALGYGDEKVDLVAHCLRDIEELAKSTCFLQINRPGSSGGMYSEHGYALARGLTCIVVGPQNSLLHYHPDTHMVETIEDAIDLLSR